MTLNTRFRSGGSTVLPLICALLSPVCAASAQNITVDNIGLSTTALTAAGGPVTISCRAYPNTNRVITNVGVYRNGSYAGGLTYQPNGAAAAANYVGTFNLPANVTGAAVPNLFTLRAESNGGDVVAALAGTVSVSAALPVKILNTALSANNLGASGGKITVTAQTRIYAPNVITNVYALRNGSSLGTLAYVSTNIDGIATYAGTFDFAANVSAAPAAYAVTVRAADSAGGSAAKSPGVVTVAAAAPIQIVQSDVSAHTLGAAGGSFTVSAKIRIDAPNAVNSISVLKSGGNIGALRYIADTTDGAKYYLGTFPVSPNVGMTAAVSALTLQAGDNAGNHAYAALGTLTVAAAAPVKILSVSVPSDRLPAAGGSIPVSAVVAAPAPNDVNSVNVLLDGGNVLSLKYADANPDGSKNYSGVLTLPAASNGASVWHTVMFHAADAAGNHAYQSGGMVIVGNSTTSEISLTGASLDRVSVPAAGGDAIVRASVRVVSPNHVNSVVVYRNGSYGGTLTYQNASADGTLNYSGSFHFDPNRSGAARPETFSVTASDTAGNAQGTPLGVVTESAAAPVTVSSVTLSDAAIGAAGGAVLVVARVAAPYPNAVYSMVLYQDGAYVGTLYYLYDNPDGTANYIASAAVSANRTDLARTDTFTVGVTDTAGNVIFASAGAVQVAAVAPITVVRASLSQSALTAAGGGVAVSATVQVSAPNAVSALTIYQDGGYAGTLRYLNTNADGAANYVGAISEPVNRGGLPRVENYTINATDNAGNVAFGTAGTLTVAALSPIHILSAAVSTRTVSATGGDVIVTAVVAAPFPNSISSVAACGNGPYMGTLKYQNANADGSANYSGSFYVPASRANTIQPYLFAIVATDNAGNLDAAAINDLTGANLAASVSGVLTLEGESVGASSQTVTFTFRSDSDADIVKTAQVGGDGAFRLTDIPRNVYTLRVKSEKNLAVIVPVSALGGDVVNVAASLPGGDANNDNSVDASDFGIFVSAYNSAASVSGSGYDPAADFNGDGAVDATDFGIFVGNYNTVGAL